MPRRERRMFDINPMELLIRVPVILLALTFHEFAHAYMAYRSGDGTAKAMGRLTVNPLAHLDPIGTICLLFAPIGWAKPVPVNPHNFRNPRRDDILVAAAGPVTNFMQAVIFLVLAKILIQHLPLSLNSDKAGLGEAGIALIFFGIVLNIGIGIFNLIPLYPLDGSHILSNMLPYEQARRFDEFNRYAPFVLLGLVLFGQRILAAIIYEPVFFIMRNILSRTEFLKILYALGKLNI